MGEFENTIRGLDSLVDFDDLIDFKSRYTLEEVLENNFNGLSKEQIIIALKAYYPEHFI